MGRKRCCGLGTSRVYTLPAPNGNGWEQLRAGSAGGWIRAAAETRFLLGKEPSPSFGPSSAAPARPMFNIIFIFCQDQTFAGRVRIEGRTPGRPPSPALPSSAPLQLGSYPQLPPPLPLPFAFVQVPGPHRPWPSFLLLARSEPYFSSISHLGNHAFMLRV